jgi:hypothetical protein
MKAGAIVLAAFIVLVVAGGPAAAEGAAPREVRNAVSADLVLPLFVGTAYVVGAFVRSPSDRGPGVNIPLSVQYQRVIGERWVLLTSLALLYHWPMPGAPAGLPGWGTIDVTPGVELGWHPFHKGLKGFHLGLSTIFNYAAAYSETPTAGISRNVMACAGVNVGWQFLFPSHVLLDLVAGPGYAWIVHLDTAGAATSTFGFNVCRTGLSIGFAF